MVRFLYACFAAFLFSCFAAAATMERPLMFFEDSPGRLPTGPLTVPTATGRITPDHLSELYGAASAALERDLFFSPWGWYTDPADPNRSSVDPATMTLAMLPGLTFEPRDCWMVYEGFDAPTNRVVGSYRLMWPMPSRGPYADGAFTPWHYLANRLFVDDQFPIYEGPYTSDDIVGSSLIDDDDFPEFAWTDDPFAAAPVESWTNAWIGLRHVVNDTMPRWGWYQDGDSLAGDFADSLFRMSESGSYSLLNDPRWQAYDAALSPRTLPRLAFSDLAAAAIPGADPWAITNRTLRLDRSFLTALEASVAVPDITQTRGYFYFRHIELTGWTSHNFSSSRPCVLDVGDISGGTVPIGVQGVTGFDWADSVVYGVSTNEWSLQFDSSYCRATADSDGWLNPELGVSAAAGQFATNDLARIMDWYLRAYPDSEDWPYGKAPDIVYSCDLSTASGHALQFACTPTVAPAISEPPPTITVPLPTNVATTVNASFQASRSGRYAWDTSADYEDYIYGVRPRLYWQNGRIDTLLHTVEGMRWTTTPSEVANNDGYQGMPTIPGGGTAQQRYRMRRVLSQTGPTYAAYTNAVAAVAAAITAETRAKVASLNGCSSFYDATWVDVDQVKNLVTPRLLYEISSPLQGQATTYSLRIYRQADLGHPMEWHAESNGRAVPLDSPWTCGMIEAGVQYSEQYTHSRQITPAAAAIDVGLAERLRVHFYNLGR